MQTQIPRPTPAITAELVVALVHADDRAAFVVARAVQQRRARAAQQVEVHA